MTWNLRRVMNRRNICLLAAVLVVLPILGVSIFFQSDPYRSTRNRRPLAETTFPSNHTQATSGDRRFVIVVPADNPGPDLCKLIASAIALGYPSPVIVNWGEDFQKSGTGFRSSHLAKISGTLDYLDTITRPDVNKGDRLGEEDIVLLLDAYDVWFQLPPSVLLQRYHTANSRANARLAQEWGSPDDDVPFQQTILISSQKRCWPAIDSGSDQHCDALPESTLPADVYGPDTDRSGQFHETRPRYLNSGSIMGPVGDMRRYFRRVKERVEKGLADGLHQTSDQGIFGEIFGEQEVWRRWRMQSRSAARNGGLVTQTSSAEGLGLVQQDFEFHVGLDYEQDMFLPTIYSANDGDFLVFEDLGDIKKRSTKLGLVPPRLSGLPDDMETTANPLNGIVTTESPTKRSSWSQLPLFADLFTTAVPAVLHHNAWRHNLKQRRVSWWDRTWYFPHLRPLLERQLRVPTTLKPLAQLPAEGGGKLSYWPPRSDAKKRRPRIYTSERLHDGLEEASLDDVCRYPGETEASAEHWYDEVFRDQKGVMT